MATSEHNKTAAFTKKHFVALLTASVCPSVLIDELRSRMDYQTWLNLMLVAIIASVSVAGASTLYRRRRSRTPNEEL